MDCNEPLPSSNLCGSVLFSFFLSGEDNLISDSRSAEQKMLFPEP